MFSFCDANVVPDLSKWIHRGKPFNWKNLRVNHHLFFLNLHWCRCHLEMWLLNLLEMVLHSFILTISWGGPGTRLVWKISSTYPEGHLKQRQTTKQVFYKITSVGKGYRGTVAFWKTWEMKKIGDWFWNDLLELKEVSYGGFLFRDLNCQYHLLLSQLFHSRTLAF